MQLWDSLQKSQARLLFGKQELSIIKRQLWGIALTQSERNRLSQIIKPKLAVIKELSKHTSEFSLKKNQQPNRLIKQLLTHMMKDQLADSIEAVLLFGSHVTNQTTWRSDIDICVVFSTRIPSRTATKFRIRMAGLSNKLDVQVFHTLPPALQQEIALHHNVLFKRPSFDNMRFSLRYQKPSSYIIRKRRFA